MENNTYTKLELENGETVELTLAFYRLYQLKSRNRSVYDRYNLIMTKGAKEELDIITILYTAYLCANIEKIGECLSEMDFLKKVPNDRKYLADTSKILTGPKKKQNFNQPS